MGNNEEMQLVIERHGNKLKAILDGMLIAEQVFSDEISAITEMQNYANEVRNVCINNTRHFEPKEDTK